MLRVLGPRPSYRALLARLAPSEAVSGVYLGRLGDLLGCFSIILEVSWVALMPHWGRLGGLLGYLWGPPPLRCLWLSLVGRDRRRRMSLVGRDRRRDLQPLSARRTSSCSCVALRALRHVPVHCHIHGRIPVPLHDGLRHELVHNLPFACVLVLIGTCSSCSCSCALLQLRLRGCSCALNCRCGCSAALTRGLRSAGTAGRWHWGLRAPPWGQRCRRRRRWRLAAGAHRAAARVGRRAARRDNRAALWMMPRRGWGRDDTSIGGCEHNAHWRCSAAVTRGLDTMARALRTQCACALQRRNDTRSGHNGTRAANTVCVGAAAPQSDRDAMARDWIKPRMHALRQRMAARVVEG